MATATSVPQVVTNTVQTDRWETINYNNHAENLEFTLISTTGTGVKLSREDDGLIRVNTSNTEQVASTWEQALQFAEQVI